MSKRISSFSIELSLICKRYPAEPFLWLQFSIWLSWNKVFGQSAGVASFKPNHYLMAVLLICCCQTSALHGFNLWGCPQPSCSLAGTTMSVPDPESSAKICMRWPNLFYFYTTLTHTVGHMYVYVCVSVCLVLKFWRAPQKCRPTKFKQCMPINFPLMLCYYSSLPSSCLLRCFLLFLLRCLVLVYMLTFEFAKQKQKH